MVTPETMWSRVREGLPVGAKWALSLTPSEAIDFVTSALAAEGAFLPQEVLDQLTGMSDAVADYRYAPRGTDVELGQMSGWADSIIASAVQARGLDSRGRPVRGAAQAGSQRGA